MTDFADPTECLVIENTGGNGGITGLTPYYYQDLAVALKHLLVLAQEEDEIIFIPTNQLRFASFLLDLIADTNGLDREYILCITSLTSSTVINELVEDCKGYIERGHYKIVIASPVFGTGFSIDKGLITTTFGFMFQYPPNTHDCVQMMARAREPKKLFIFAERARLGKKMEMFINGKTPRVVDTSWWSEMVRLNFIFYKKDSASVVRIFYIEHSPSVSCYCFTFISYHV